MTPKSILVTGANGIVGHVVVQYLIKNGYAVTAVSRKMQDFHQSQVLLGDLTDDRFLKCFETTEIHSIIHLAASVPHNPKCSAEENYLITTY